MGGRRLRARQPARSRTARLGSVYVRLSGGDAGCVRGRACAHHRTQARHADRAHGRRPLEITTYRTEGGYSDGRHPDGVRFVTDIREDLARRDFTVGAMAWHPERGLCDPFGGQTDLKNGILRAVGDADTRFQEDALRILRGLRFASKLGFAIEPETAAAMRRQVHRLHCIAAERIREELTGLLCGRYVQRTLMTYADLITSALPELAPMQGCQQQNPHHLYDVWEHTVRAVGQVPAEPVLRWAMLLHDSGKPACKTVDEQGIGHFRGHPKVSREIAERVVARLRFSTEDSERILLLVERHDTPLGDNEKLVRRSLSLHRRSAVPRPAGD